MIILISKMQENSKIMFVPTNGGAAVRISRWNISWNRQACLYLYANSGIGNAVNPIASLLNEEVYDIPATYIVGWRGEPGVHDEPQHKFQGIITQDLFKVLNIKN